MRGHARIRDATSTALQEGLRYRDATPRRNVRAGKDHRRKPPPAAGNRNRAVFRPPRWPQREESCWIRSASMSGDRKGGLPELFPASSGEAQNVRQFLPAGTARSDVRRFDAGRGRQGSFVGGVGRASAYRFSLAQIEKRQTKACPTETKGFTRTMKGYPTFPGGRVERTNSRRAETFGP